MAFNYLRDYLGDSVFDAAMHEYFRQWKFKHPQPEDLHKLFETQLQAKIYHGFLLIYWVQPNEWTTKWSASKISSYL